MDKQNTIKRLFREIRSLRKQNIELTNEQISMVKIIQHLNKEKDSLIDLIEKINQKDLNTLGV